MQTISEIARTPQYRRYRLDGVSAEDAVERIRSAAAYRASAITTCEKATRKLAKRSVA